MRAVLASLLLTFLIASGNTAAMAGNADVIAAEAVKNADGSWRIHVTVAHNDEGWDHYADRWEVRTVDGELLGTRVLLHPLVNEQPFTRSLGGLIIPEDVGAVVITAHDTVHDDGGKEIFLLLPR